jgi:hypothetical protein
MRQIIVSTIAMMSFANLALAEDKTAAKQAAGAMTKSAETAPAANIVEIEGTIVKVVEKKKEIYVKDAAGKKHEFYFKPHTKLTAAGAPAEFSALKEGLTVKVAAEKHGKRLDPLTVEIR